MRPWLTPTIAVTFLVTTACVLSGTVPSNADTRDFAVEVSAAIQESPPRIDFTWVPDLSASEYRILKRSFGDTVWAGPIAVLGGEATSFRDTEVAVGTAYEYAFRKTVGLIADTVRVESGTAVTFTIFDAWGDGICCDYCLGSYQVTGCDSVYAAGGAFHSSEATSFVVGSPEHPCSELVVEITLDIFGDETSWELVDDSNGQILARGGPYSPPRFGHIFAGIRYAPPEFGGTVLLVVDEPVAAPLATELERLKLDLVRDGYRVRRHDVPHGTSAPAVRELVIGACRADPAVSTLFLLGNITVPYSGDVRGAVHPDEWGAWPADLYYGELDGVWTDSTVTDTSATRPEHHNVPGDGKFDQTYLPSDMELQVGRVDLSRLPAFDESEVDLLRRYLDKDHAYRSGQLEVERRGLIEDHVGELYGTAYACTGWRNFTAMFGSPAVSAGSWLPLLEMESYLCAYGCGPGSYTGCMGVITTGDFAARSIYAVLTMLKGSYFGDWDTTNNLLRAVLAARGHPLASSWAGHPAWHLHHMALGHPLGYSARLTQNNHTQYMIGYGGRQIMNALMGDPTIKLHVALPPRELQLETLSGGEVRLTWRAPEDTAAVAGYHVYRAAGLDDSFSRMNPALVTDTTFVDDTPLPGRGVYLVRAAKLETTASGTYYNLSPGAIDSILIGTGIEDVRPGVWLRSFPNPSPAGTTIAFRLDIPAYVLLRIHDVAGRLVRTIDAGPLPAGAHSVIWDGGDADGRRVASGVYCVSLHADGATRSIKVVRSESGRHDR